MFAQSYGAVTFGLSGHIITVEVDISTHVPSFDIVGLPAAAVKESKERVRSAIKNSGYRFPVYRITVNLAPADLRKEGSGLDLPIAVGILAASGQLPEEAIQGCLFVGELSLRGELRPVPGILSMVLAGKEAGFRKYIMAPDAAQEALLAEGTEIYGPRTLAELVEGLLGRTPLVPAVRKEPAPAPEETADLADVQGQLIAKRALEIAAAGAHNLLMTGPPGSGKTMLARRITAILPSMTDEEALEVTKIYSVAGLFKTERILRDRPFRSPHHTISMAGLIGGGTVPRPGEVTLAHRGVLFLDELPEFPRSVLEVLRQPLEDRVVRIARANAAFTYPADFILIAAMNPCPCGYLGDPDHECTCTDGEIQRYRWCLSFLSTPKSKYTEISPFSKGCSAKRAAAFLFYQPFTAEKEPCGRFIIQFSPTYLLSTAFIITISADFGEFIMPQEGAKSYMRRNQGRFIKITEATVADFHVDEIFITLLSTSYENKGHSRRI